MREVVFIDDEQSVLSGLRTGLFRMRRDWQMRFAGSGREALAMLEERPADVVVSDLRMPGMDGAEVLGEVARRWPESVRVVLSGHGQQEDILRAAEVSHRFLSKPCAIDTLRDLFLQMETLFTLVPERPLRSKLAGLCATPVSDRVYSDLCSSLNRESATIAELTSIVERDVGLSVRLLQVVNSSYLRLSRRINVIGEAIVHLGFESLRGIALHHRLFHLLDGKALECQPDHAHAHCVARLAKELHGEQRDGDAFATGLLHDIGLLIGPHAADVLDDGISDDGMHARLGAFLLGLWAIPSPTVTAVSSHHNLDLAPDSLAGAVYQADAIARLAAGGADAPESLPDHPRTDDLLRLARDILTHGVGHG